MIFVFSSNLGDATSLEEQEQGSFMEHNWQHGY